jgi:hypothetical protein
VPPLRLPALTSELLSLEQLTRPEAVRLFVKRAQAEDGDFQVTRHLTPEALLYRLERQAHSRAPVILQLPEKARACSYRSAAPGRTPSPLRRAAPDSVCVRKSFVKQLQANPNNFISWNSQDWWLNH